MRKALLGVWLTLPLCAWAYHEGPGQDRLDLDEVDRLVSEAHDDAQGDRWAAAVTKYGKALSTLPEDRKTEAWRIRLELNKARMMASELPAANSDLQALVSDMQKEAAQTGEAGQSVDAALLDDARSALANSQYYLAWLMRLEGMPREKWEPEIEVARQHFRLLAERSESSGDVAAAKKNREDLESAIRLARIELKELQGLPLPNQ